MALARSPGHPEAAAPRGAPSHRVGARASAGRGPTRGEDEAIVIGWSTLETNSSTGKAALKIDASGTHLAREILES